MSLLVNRWSVAMRQPVGMDHMVSVSADGADHQSLHYIIVFFSPVVFFVEYHPPDK